MKIILWLPRSDEHALARSLGLVDLNEAELIERIRGVQRDAGSPVIVKRWHVWRVVRALATLGLTNTSEARANAFAYLAMRAGESE